MIEKCFDEGKIQAFLDGELDLKQIEQLTRHIALCDDCAVAVAEAEAEMAVTFAALDREIDTLVPTQRLWTKINHSIEAQNKNRSLWQTVFDFLTTPTSVAFASLLIVFGLFIGLYSLKNDVKDNGGNIAGQKPAPKNETVDVAVTGSPVYPAGNPAVAAEPEERFVKTGPETDRPKESGAFRVIRTDHSVNEINPAVGGRSKTEVKTDVVTPVPLVAEDSYIRTIKTLESTVDGRKDAVLDTSARFAFEKDMAVANSTIEQLKAEVERNPNNKTARELLRNTYQTKISLLNSVAEKTELMASLN